ncbi:hypothetical protein ALC60_08290 [Trachymyrmex zeteki]|uniref:Uncharacterized protein n=1 Tax=Mycetomoellerius zeteki TaxID=64791 RepID=A0A151WXD6_9HYME|nr:hypothetical protein ALC60_08290 [Trachymyrmex zeteki]
MLFLPAGFLHSTSWDDKIRRNSRRNALCLVIENRGEKGTVGCWIEGREASASADTSMHTESCTLVAVCRHDTECSLSRGELQVTFIFYGTITMRVAAAVRRPGPCTGSIRITVTHDQRIHAAGPVDRHTLAPSVLMQTAATA